MSQDETRPHLAGALFEATPALVRMVTTDGHRLTKIERTLDAPGEATFTMLMPQKGVSELKKLVEDGQGEGRDRDVRTATRSSVAAPPTAARAR